MHIGQLVTTTYKHIFPKVGILVKMKPIINTYWVYFEEIGTVKFTGEELNYV